MTLLDASHLLATLVFVGGSAVVAARLLALGRRSGDLPALLLGGAIGGTAVLGYGVLIAAMILRGDPRVQPDASSLAVFLSGTGRVVHDLGVALHLAFVVHVFRPRVVWARALAGALVTLLWVGLIAGALDGSFREVAVGSWPWIAENAVIWTYPIWGVIEAYRYALLMRRRAAFGLGSPVVANRFVLWGTASLFTVIATWVASLPYLYVGDLAGLAAVTPAIRVATAVAGLVSVTCSLFAFLPPLWYRRWIEARAAGAPARA